ncbi:hypothetical protein PUNSTDRAFT_131150 [Punctularia strigosozonata HHB-11173 SS5]|uniref:uncharacterized protein n=1 Tax=Punctularia strigosozonata (strain HHB-11173) TaxID=741275 RepID=UPI0004416AC3|nr:uncharacterized protein PUNSTDRAFT_131150 [Punctularia strigosozonata HHB-11173 SS5]EIN12919.1 hypothetical protein PUNSTDRAFT_131150 [Punctularia strigosozonata HHB-11173 SS5]
MNFDQPADYYDYNVPELVDDLNNLIRALHLHNIEVQSPEELTPSLLLGLLECIVQARLPISQDIRRARDLGAKVQAMKIFLGVLEDDVLQQDVGLANVDPRRLAEGEWDETVYVGQVLCWLARRRDILPAEPEEGPDVDPSTLPRLPLPHLQTLSPSTRSTTTNSMNTGLSITSSSEETVTTADLQPSEGDEPMDDENHVPPRCIHEVDDTPSFSFGVPANESHLGVRGSNVPAYDADDPFAICDCATRASASSEGNRPPIRHTGWIERADEESEVNTFEASYRQVRQATPKRPDSITTPDARRPSLPSGFTPPHSSTPKKKVYDRITARQDLESPTRRRIQLLNERARLLSELAKLSI